jgi:hypothetical protein
MHQLLPLDADDGVLLRIKCDLAHPDIPLSECRKWASAQLFLGASDRDKLVALEVALGGRDIK